MCLLEPDPVYLIQINISLTNKNNVSSNSNTYWGLSKNLKRDNILIKCLKLPLPCLFLFQNSSHCGVAPLSVLLALSELPKYVLPTLCTPTLLPFWINYFLLLLVSFLSDINSPWPVWFPPIPQCFSPQ